MIDEGPSQEDIRRFGGDSAYCPDCGAEVWHDADVCSKCGNIITGGTRSRKPHDRWLTQRAAAVIVIILVILLSGIFALLRVF